ncbi:Endothelin-converting enzyme 1 [Plesiocystis pacifica SIR-1]|uniref:Endothelin-converting enzyme 1 n=1 Tax=Plesiocystis pacifica SIR-1 TaxID=391625 RepID=A6G377_9BACT|nr:M13 family metallopeptidase [Plesiocystis pacifica]EDM79702.1 Endothelin-converting enzyme 1 [Plesiocystis pacifica SIR-1]
MLRSAALPLTCCSLLAALACKPGDSTTPDASPQPEPAHVDDVAVEPSGEVPSTGIEGLVASIDADADPCQDFYRYACGGWLDSHPRPADKPRYGRSFNTVQDNNRAILASVLDAAAAKAAAGEAGLDPGTQKLGGYYGACTDMAARDAAGIEPLAPILAKIDGLKSKKALMPLVGELHATVWGRVGWLGMPAMPPFFMVGVDADYMDAPDMNMAIFVQSGLGLPSRAMYLPPEGAEGEGGRALLAAYEAHIAEMLTLSGVEAAQAKADAEAVVAIEVALAEASLTPVQRRDSEANYHKVGFKGLKRRAKGLDWKGYFQAAGLPETKSVNLESPEYMGAVAELIKDRPLPELQAYLRWMVVHATANDLSSTFVDANFGLAKLVLGVEEMAPLEERCNDSVMWALPDLIGQAYVADAFPGDSKAIADDMINRINAAMEASFPTLEWMDDTTRGRAKDKIAAMGRKIGYPDAWKDYAEVEIGASHFANVLAEKRAHAAHQVSQVDEPVDKAEWHMPAPLVNAYYNPTGNEIAFPAGILQPPFFDASAPMVMNFGGIGAVAGHELTHGFDDQGRKYDATGRLREWWEPQVSKAFEERVACVVSQYDAYTIESGAAVSGELTAGENIADIGGVKEAYMAYQTWAAEQGEAGAAPVAEGMTNEQVFFVAWGQNWCQHASEAEAERRRQVDPHSPGRWRAMGPLIDLPAFAEAFSCEPGTPMNPTDRCEIW